MKKLISLIASLSLVATMVTSVSAADLANNNPVLDTTVTELTSEDLMGIVGETIPDGQKAFLIDINVNGVDLLVQRADATYNGKKARTGIVIQAGQYNLVNMVGAENVVQVYQLDDGAFPGAGNFQMLLNANAPTEAYPTTTDAATTAVTMDTAHLNTYVVFTNGNTVTGDVYAALKISGAAYNASAATKNYFDGTKTWNTWESTLPCTVNGESGSVVTLGASAPVDPITVGTRHDLAAGKAWDVTINEYDAAKTYTATFTDTDTTETKVNDFDLSIFAESDGAKVAFVTLLKTTRANITLDVE